ncbi:MAG: LytTR family transcriptional regulator DNA-binding domain-containing protein [Bacteroidia bacterium]|nr:LytTR family transcriptional regulator DNA-binding domain-containing protein [Bacteroidia bacterium]
MKKPVYYKNWWIWVGVPVISVLATFVGTPHTIFDPILYVKMGLNLAIVSFVWLLAYAFTLFMDKRMPWESTSHLKRWVFQLGIFIPLGTSIDAFGLILRNQIIEWPFSWHLFFYTDFPIQIFFTSLIFYLYQQAYLKYREEKAKQEEVAEKSWNSFRIKRGKKTYVIPVEEIAYFYRKDQFNYLCKKSGEAYMVDESLSAIEQKLDASSFFRINRQLLAHRTSISSFKVLPNRQTELAVEPEMDPLPLLNKNRSAQFKQWVKLD